MKGNHSSCYRCGAPASSREHIPPLCFFPEAKEAGGRDLRRNLVTIPSCDDHNLKKSKDDEFLMASIAGIIGNNETGLRHKLTKVDRAFRRTSWRLLDRVFSSREHFIVKDLGEGQFIEVIWGTPDHERLIRCFEAISYGIMFRELGAPFRGGFKVFLGHLRYSDPNSAEFKRFIKDRIDLDMRERPRVGANPEVFFYQLSGEDQFGLSSIRLCFYGGVEIFVAVIPEGKEVQPDIGMLLISKGMKTFLSLGERRYEFN